MPATTVSVVPKYRHHKGTGQAFVQIKGHRHYLGRWNTPASKERYAAFVAELAVRPTPLPPPRADSRITVTELADAYWDFAQRVLLQERDPQWMAGPHSAHASEASPDLRVDPSRRLRTAEAEGHSANLDRRQPQPHVHQQAGADHPPHVQVGRGRGDRTWRRLPRPPHRRRAEKGTDGRPRDQARAAGRRRGGRGHSASPTRRRGRYGPIPAVDGRSPRRGLPATPMRCGSQRRSLAVPAGQSQDRAPRPRADDLRRPEGPAGLTPLPSS